MDRENYIMGQNCTSVVTSTFLCCADSQSNYSIYVFFNDIKLVSEVNVVFEKSLQCEQHSNPAD